MITTVKLDGRKYLAWSQPARMFIGSRRKSWYITGSKKEPPADDPSHEDWESNNLTVMSWLLHSMQPTISVARGVLEDSKGDMGYSPRDVFSEKFFGTKLPTASGDFHHAARGDAHGRVLRGSEKVGGIRSLSALSDHSRRKVLGKIIRSGESSSIWPGFDLSMSFRACRFKLGKDT